METRQRPDPVERLQRRRLNRLLIAILIAAWAVVAVTTQVRSFAPTFLLVNNLDQIIAVEVTFFGILLVETAGKLLVNHYSNRDIVSVGIALRAVLRVVAYTVIAVIGVSLMAQNPALALSVGTVTGVVVGFSAQSVIANIIAGMFLAIGRPFRIGDQITTSGVTGRVTDIGLMHTILDAGENWVLAPNSVILTGVLQRKKQPPDTTLLPRDRGEKT